MEKTLEMRFSKNVIFAMGYIFAILRGNFWFVPKKEVQYEDEDWMRVGNAYCVPKPAWDNFIFFSEITATPSRLAATDENGRDWLQRQVRFFHGDAIVAVVTIERMVDGSVDTSWKACAIRYALRASGKPHETEQWIELDLAVPVFENV